MTRQRVVLQLMVRKAGSEEIQARAEKNFVAKVHLSARRFRERLLPVQTLPR